MSVGLSSEFAEQGWMELPTSLQEVVIRGRGLGWREVVLRRGDPPLSNIRSVPSSLARPRSMSAQIGLGAQPLHTDGAHLAQPPHVVALSLNGGHPVATRLLDLRGSEPPWDDLRHGVFAVRDGHQHVHCVALADDGSLRFDPCCMRPCDARARRVVAFFAEALPPSARYEWSGESPTVLLIDNRRVLHARDLVRPEDPPRVVQRVTFRINESP